ncbi:MAG: SDR family oxidoreductase [Nitrosomonadales bacterium]|nr:SDR family oxidoreductase [Nitrosomonadales bacterium]
MNAKTVLITGAGSGFGRDTALTLAREGHNVYASMRDLAVRNRDKVELLAAEAAEEKLPLQIIELDVTSTDSVNRAVAHVVAEAGHIDVLINNAGFAAAGVSEGFTDAQVLNQFDVNVVGVQRTLRAVLMHMRKRKDGLVINIGSILGRVTFPFFGIYGASKFAVEALTESYRYEVSQLGVDVVLVQPSAYPTNMYSSMQFPSDEMRVSEYGAIGEIPGTMFQHFTTMFSAVDAPNPHDVAEAIAKLVAQPKGTRPARTVVGADFGSTAINRQTEPLQAGVVEALGLGRLATVA